MKAGPKIAVAFFLAHSVMPLWIFIRLLQLTDGEMRWAATMISYWVDFPLFPIYLWFQDSPLIGESSFINTGISFVAGGLMYSAIGWTIGHFFFDRRRDKASLAATMEK